jgi:hypothetical protein
VDNSPWTLIIDGHEYQGSITELQVTLPIVSTYTPMTGCSATLEMKAARWNVKNCRKLWPGPPGGKRARRARFYARQRKLRWLARQVRQDLERFYGRPLTPELRDEVIEQVYHSLR